ncbi:hypothetical protein [Patulibacter sp.]|uniref:hypothetical protein n=1 Tax=Patulibacter sp. TaxID=1912859 RepID=UPI002718E6DB|nr:hypothetical protein [Patulibacter sp.]MDO9407309.1 hypothetical protein [Patulibacter sp.]
MTPEDVAATIRSFFEAVGGASLELSDGWFGRPHDNHHVLDGVEVAGDDVVVRIDGLQVLTLHGPDLASADGRVLTLAGFHHATWDRAEYGSDPPRRHVRRVPPGRIRFVA